MVNIGNDWDEILEPIFSGDNYLQIRTFLKNEYFTRTIFPPMEDIFNAFKLTSFHDTKVVILGQDPYHNEGEAHGLCFSVKQGVKMPPSLANIYKELKDDLGVDNGTKTDLTPWAKQGVLLLNTTLTVREGQANSHKNCGWTEFTDSVISILGKRTDPLVFILWGANARSKKSLIDKNHLVLECAHPSPLSAYNGFFGCRHFSKTNAFLTALGKEPINWQL